MFLRASCQNYSKIMDNDVAFLKNIFEKSVRSVQPQKLIRKCIKVDKDYLLVKDKKFTIKKPIFMVGFGKAVLGMAVEIEQALSSKLQRAIISVPEGIFRDFPQFKRSDKIEYIEGAKNNIPDENALIASEKIKNIAENLIEEDLLLVLISGGGSALLPLPKPPITLEDKQTLITQLAQSGANISELNCVRKHISVLKGGGLAKIAEPARVVSLILSDVIGDPLDVIASGPTVKNTKTVADAINVIKKYLNYNKLPESIRKVLEQSVECPDLKNTVDNIIIGNNRIAAEAAKDAALERGLTSYIVSTEISGEVGEVAKYYSNLALDLINQNKKGTLFIGAGEPTLTVHGKGKGGRNQQLVLEFVQLLSKEDVKNDVLFLSGGTDGIDGPTDAAGAVATTDLIRNYQNIKPSPQDYLNNNDSYNFWTSYNKGENLIKIGHTGTNVMDLHILYIK